MRASNARPTSCSLTPATGITSRWNAWAPGASAFSSCPTPRNAPARAPAGTAASTRFRRRVLDSDAGGELYAKRQTMIEPIFADTKFNRRIDRFLRRGRSAVRSEWRLANAAHNLLKLWRPTNAPAAA
ncbi:MAG: transposase [Actinobacteria bacterium]|nr:transposase [Actinomycetota bacterium]